MYVVGLFSKDLCNVSKHVFQDFPYFFSPRHDHYKKKPDTPFSSQYQLLMSCTVIRSFTKKIHFLSLRLFIYVVYPVLTKDMICYWGSIKLRKIEVKCKPMKGSGLLDIIQFFDIN